MVDHQLNTNHVMPRFRSGTPDTAEPLGVIVSSKKYKYLSNSNSEVILNIKEILKNKIVKISKLYIMKITPIIICTSILLFSCKKSVDNSNSNLSQVFNKEEIEQLEYIEQIFQDNIESKFDCKNSTCYNKYLNHLLSFEKSGDLKIEFPKSELTKIMENTNQNLLKEIWFNHQNEEYKYLHLNKQGKYYDFLKRLSNSNENVKTYLNIYDKIGDYSPSLVAGSIPRFVKEDFSDKELRLFKAIHFISCSSNRMND